MERQEAKLAKSKFFHGTPRSQERQDFLAISSDPDHNVLGELGLLAGLAAL
ncbi:hypothetical protein [Methanocella arvoryzae]|uniref:hypothetical protein n=1 Tax=Methanocella arvoryzae TaxID=1175445 RepID=UPI00130543AF|nr:hypothetical protein [Methanocella arvoryzae]